MDENIKHIKITLGGKAVGGCVKLTASVNLNSKEIYEYLNSIPYAVTSESVRYEVKLLLVGNYTNYSLTELSELVIQGDNFNIIYSGCSVIADREFSDNGKLFRELTIGCSKRSAENE